MSLYPKRTMLIKNSVETGAWLMTFCQTHHNFGTKQVTCFSRMTGFNLESFNGIAKQSLSLVIASLQSTSKAIPI